jgi:hypothetical protein
MYQHQAPVARQLHIKLYLISSEINGATNRAQRIFRFEKTGSPV